jgi:hypothetical protein
MSAHDTQNYLGDEPGTNLHRALKEACIAWTKQFGETTGLMPDPRTMGLIVGCFSRELELVLMECFAEQSEVASINYRVGYEEGYQSCVDPDFSAGLKAAADKLVR